MISFTVRMKFAPEDRAEIVEALGLLTTASRQEPGCVSYIPTYLEGEPESFFLFEQYRDQESLTAHCESAHYKRYAIGCLYQKLLKRETENLVALL